MKMTVLAKLLPCTVFLANGRVFAAIAALLMQVSLLLWPIASLWALRLEERKELETLLSELSEPNGLLAGAFPTFAENLGHAA